MKKKYSLSSWISPIPVATILFSSCLPAYQVIDPYLVDESRQKENVYYVPPMPNTPLLSKKGDLDFNVARSSGPGSTGVELQAAYLPWQHVGLLGSYTYATHKDGGYEYMNYNRYELGAGYTTELPGGLQVETYAGVGNGKIRNVHYSGISDVSQTQYFLQPAIYISNKKKTVQLAFVSRFAGVHFKVEDTLFNTDRERLSAVQLNSLYAQPTHVMWEPGLVFRFGWKNFLFHTGYSYSADLTNPDLYRSQGTFSMGLSIRVNTIE